MGLRRRRRRGPLTTAGPPPDGLSLRLEEAEELGRVRDLGGLLRAIKEVLPEDAVLYLEGSRRHMASELRELLQANPVPHPKQLARGTLWPKPAQFHLHATDRNLDRLRDIESRHPEPEICDHLVVYQGDEVLLTAYVAGDGDVFVSKHLPAEDIGRMRQVLGLQADES